MSDAYMMCIKRCGEIIYICHGALGGSAGYVVSITSGLFEEAPGLLMITFTNALTNDSYLYGTVIGDDSEKVGNQAS